MTFITLNNGYEVDVDKNIDELIEELKHFGLSYYGNDVAVDTEPTTWLRFNATGKLYCIDENNPRHGKERYEPSFIRIYTNTFRGDLIRIGIIAFSILGTIATVVLISKAVSP